jgi:hypothetical protein
MTRYTIVESYLYDVDADTPEQARELFESYMENGSDLNSDDVTGVSFLQNVTTIENENGEEV